MASSIGVIGANIVDGISLQELRILAKPIEWVEWNILGSRDLFRGIEERAPKVVGGILGS
jgi:hypothetical protein